jgi:putative tryptophan/tyrosine transport system substrate-binding protein
VSGIGESAYFAIVADPVGSGFVASYPRPGGNATGFTTLEPTMAGKWLELLKQIAPRVNRAALLFTPGQRRRSASKIAWHP